MKICSKCKSEYSDDMFEHNRRQCKNCRTDIMKRQNAKYYKENKEKFDEYHKNFVQENEGQLKEYRKNYRQKNRVIILTNKRRYYQNNKDKIKISCREYQRKRKKNDLVFKFRANISTLISRALKQQQSSKDGKSCLRHLPYTFEHLVVYLEKQFEPWMNWNNYGRYDTKKWSDDDQNTWTWNLDHVVPQSDLPYTSMQDENFQKCWALINLRPLSAKRNHLDGINKTRHVK